MQSEVIPMFESKELNNIAKLPPVLQRFLASLDFSVGRINVLEDGYCGYHVIGLLNYMNTCQLISREELELYRVQALCQSGLPRETEQKLVMAARHYLEYIEVGLIISKILPDLNVGMVVQTDVKFSGQRSQRTYPIRTVTYQKGRPWAFILMSRGAYHYELLTVIEKGRHRSNFTESEAKQVFAACSTEYPHQVVRANDHAVFLDSNDLFYF